MTERKLFLMMADLFDSTEPYELKSKDTKTVVVPCVTPDKAKPDGFAFGLCRCMAIIRDQHKVDQKTFASANKEMEADLGKDFGWVHGKNGYAFPLTEAGAKQRAEFCRKLAAKEF